MHMIAMLPFATATGGVAAGTVATGAPLSLAAMAGGGGGLTLMGALSGGLGIASGLAAIARGNAEASAMETEANFEEFNASQELLKGRAQALEAMRAANDAVAASTVAGFASGLQGSGSVARAREEAFEEGDFQISMARSNAAIAAGMRRGTANSLRRDAGWARFGGWADAAGQFAETAFRFRTTG
jgi:hypothetical protein